MLALAIQGEWAKIGPDFDRSWRTVGPRILVLMVAAQRGAAGDGANYLPALLAETHQTAPLAATPNYGPLAGVASNGRPLDSLLYGGVIEAKQAVGAGASPADGLAQGGRWLGMVSSSQVIDAATMAQGISRVCRPAITGYIRTVSGGACKRCAVLAGKWYRYNASFERHPRCNCDGMETTERFDKSKMLADAKAEVKHVIASGGVTDLTVAERAALSEGADFSSIVNSRQVTQFNRSLGHTRVEDIYREATSRDEAIALLKDHGFIAR